jgi:putative transposase
MKNDYLQPLVPGRCYHIYNRTNNKEALFLDDENRRFFLQQYRNYFEAITNTYAYCLLDNHFHFFIRIKSQEEFTDNLLSAPQLLTARQKVLLDDNNFDTLLQLQFQRFFISYSMAFNARWERNGNLFNRPFKRVLIEDEAQYSWLVFYIHNNPVKHGLMPDFKAWKWSSYQAYLSNATTSICKQDMLDWFGGLKGFTRFHAQENMQLKPALIIEE